MLNIEKFILDSLKKNKTTKQIRMELQAKNIELSRKTINNKITTMRVRGIEIPFLRGATMAVKKPIKSKRVELGISHLSNGNYKVQKRVSGKVFNKVFKSLEDSRAFRDSLTPEFVKSGIASVTTQPKTTSALAPVATAPVSLSTEKKPYKKQEPKLSNLALSDIFENNGNFVVIISKDLNILSTLVERVLG